jgi:hypothetical protein
VTYDIAFLDKNHTTVINIGSWGLDDDSGVKGKDLQGSRRSSESPAAIESRAAPANVPRAIHLPEFKVPDLHLPRDALKMIAIKMNPALLFVSIARFQIRTDIVDCISHAS